MIWFTSRFLLLFGLLVLWESRSDHSLVTGLVLIAVGVAVEIFDRRSRS